MADIALANCARISSLGTKQVILRWHQKAGDESQFTPLVSQEANENPVRHHAILECH
jgi:hypothetical protein